jgi:predicted nucleotidyltransferase
MEQSTVFPGESKAMREELQTRLGITDAQLAEFCQSWKIAELSLFGSVLRDDFGPDSDIDLLVTYGPAPRRSLIDHMKLEKELQNLLGRKIDLVSRRGVEHSGNWLLKRIILESAEPIYESE